MAVNQAWMPGNTGTSRTGAYDAWANDYRNWQYANQGYNKSGAAEAPKFTPNYGSPGGGVNGMIDRMRNEADPRSITQSPAMQRLMSLANGGSAVSRADEVAGPAVARLNEYLAKADPLGTGNLATLQRQRGTAELRGAAAGGKRRVEESFGGMHGSADPSALAFMKDIISGNAAAGMGEVERGAAETDIRQKAETAAFHKGVADSMMQWGGVRGGLANAEANTNVNAAGNALQAESYARNKWADIFAHILGLQFQGGSGGGKRPIRGYDKEGNPIYDRNPFPSPDQFDSLGNLRESVGFGQPQSGFFHGDGRGTAAQRTAYNGPPPTESIPPDLSRDYGPSF